MLKIISIHIKDNLYTVNAKLVNYNLSFLFQFQSLSTFFFWKRQVQKLSTAYEKATVRVMSYIKKGEPCRSPETDHLFHMYQKFFKSILDIIL